jgi:hypothetical protein
LLPRTARAAGAAMARRICETGVRPVRTVFVTATVNALTVADQAGNLARQLSHPRHSRLRTHIMKHPASQRRLPRLSRLVTLTLAATACLGAFSGPNGPHPEDQVFSKKAIDAYLDAARARTLAACTAKGLTLPADFLAWIDSDPVVRASVYGCRNNPLPVLLGLRSLEIDLGEQIVRRDYPQLALAFAIQGSYTAPSRKASGWNDGDGAPPTEPCLTSGRAHRSNS